MATHDLAREQVVAAAQDLTRKGYLMATGGNLSVRIPGENAFAITPSNYDYMKMVPGDVCVLGLDLKPIAGERKPSVESGMHAGIYTVRGDVQAIVHTHQVYASALALMQTPIPGLFDEQLRFLGRQVEVIPYAPSGTGMLKNTIMRAVKNHHNAYLMKNHGALCFGHDIERASHNTEILEKCALAYLLSILANKKVERIPLAIREITFAKLRKDQKRIEKGVLAMGGE